MSEQRAGGQARVCLVKAGGEGQHVQSPQERRSGRLGLTVHRGGDGRGDH